MFLAYDRTNMLCTCKQQLSLHNHVTSIPNEVACLMRCIVVSPSTVLLVDSHADYATASGL